MLVWLFFFFVMCCSRFNIIVQFTAIPYALNVRSQTIKLFRNDEIPPYDMYHILQFNIITASYLSSSRLSKMCVLLPPFGETDSNNVGGGSLFILSVCYGKKTFRLRTFQVSFTLHKHFIYKWIDRARAYVWLETEFFHIKVSRAMCLHRIFSSFLVPFRCSNGQLLFHRLTNENGVNHW